LLVRRGKAWGTGNNSKTSVLTANKKKKPNQGKRETNLQEGVTGWGELFFKLGVLIRDKKSAWGGRKPDAEMKSQRRMRERNSTPVSSQIQAQPPLGRG